MSKTTKIVLGFAAVGFLMPWLLLTFYAVAAHFDLHTSPALTAVLFYLCPASVMSMGTDNAVQAEAIRIWMIIAATNAVLYAVTSFILVLSYRIVRRAGYSDN
jgi:heme A synthase